MYMYMCICSYFVPKIPKMRALIFALASDKPSSSILMEFRALTACNSVVVVWHLRLVPLHVSLLETVGGRAWLHWWKTPCKRLREKAYGNTKVFKNRIGIRIYRTKCALKHNEKNFTNWLFIFTIAILGKTPCARIISRCAALFV